jgi:hypothetical protein
MSDYDNKGKGAFWSNQYFEQGGKMPKWTGKFEAHRDIKAGEEIPLSMWPAERKNENSPVLRFSVDSYKEAKAKGNVQAISHETRDFPDDSDIPF